MYFPYFIAYMGIGITLAVVVFIWALKNGQFNDQQRARFLPLEAEADAGGAKSSSMGRLETYVLAFLACAGLAASAAVLIFALYFS
ncbi:MAG: cbb3-type cytochrome oxidase assembly protein CcoS [Desulfobacteraceae bacterium]|nr:cbb3-type cytochrome oxidase assembly protein CcoS [Desulfobacteraceae bacterium]